MQRWFQDFDKSLAGVFSPGADSISASSYKSGKKNLSGQTATQTNLKCRLQWGSPLTCKQTLSAHWTLIKLLQHFLVSGLTLFAWHHHMGCPALWHNTIHHIHHRPPFRKAQTDLNDQQSERCLKGRDAAVAFHSGWSAIWVCRGQVADHIHVICTISSPQVRDRWWRDSSTPACVPPLAIT